MDEDGEGGAVAAVASIEIGFQNVEHVPVGTVPTAGADNNNNSVRCL